MYEIEASEDFEYYYISFMGVGVNELLEELGITFFNPVYPDLSELINFWSESICRITNKNAELITQSVLLHALSYIDNTDSKEHDKKNNDNVFEAIVNYIDNHYREPDLSLKKLSEIFSYTEKYLSHIFKKKMDVSFKTYINNIRIQYAYHLIENNETSVSKIAYLCGYSDSLYFSKVFKKARGISPSDYIKKQ